MRTRAPGSVRRRARVGLGSLGTLFLLLGPGVGGAAHAQTDGREVTRYAADIEVAADGVADVRVELDFDFGDEPGHGPFLTLPTRQAIAGDDERDRLFRISDVGASSDTAPDDLDVEETDEGLVLRIGDEDVDDVDGVHTYVVRYRVEGWVNPDVREEDSFDGRTGDELFLDVLGPAWEVPLSDISARITGPAPVDDVACFAGPRGSTDPCTEASGAGGATATFRQDAVDAGEPFTVAVRWPAGTFPGVEPILGDKLVESDPFRPTPLAGAAALLIAGAGGALAVGRVRRQGRDRSALGLPPGMAPGADHLAGTFRDHRPPVAVQSAPPEGVLPGELGTLLDEVADPRDVTATIVDLAVRGHLHIREVPPQDPRDPVEDWDLLRVDGDVAGLAEFERTLLAGVFCDSAEVRMSDLARSFSSVMSDVQRDLYRHVTERGWFTANPRTVRRRWYLTGALLLVLALLVGFVSLGVPFDGLGLVAVAVGLVGVVVLLVAHAAPARSAAGTGVLADAVAFKRYLETADVDLLRAAHGDDVFSRYLPYAIAFDLTDEFTGVFGRLAEERERRPDAAWYSGYRERSSAGGAPVGAWVTGTGIGHFATATTASLSAATSGSSGGSGFSGGSSGGGVGGGGGGGW